MNGATSNPAVASQLLFPAERVAFVTGAGSGIGRAVSLQFLADGAQQIALVDLLQPGLDETVALISAGFPKAKAITITADVSKEEEVENAVLEAVRAFGRIDHCCNAAGIAGEFNPTSLQSTANLEKVLDINLKGVFFCERAQIQQMKKQKFRPSSTGLNVESKGSIVNIASINGHVGMPALSPYNMAKFGVIGLSKTDAIDYAGEGIRVNAVSPGFCRSNLVDAATWDGLHPIVLTTPAKRLGLVQEIAFSVCFLASDRSSYTTGVSLTVDGGYTCR